MSVVVLTSIPIVPQTTGDHYDRNYAFSELIELMTYSTVKLTYCKAQFDHLGHWRFS